MRFDRVILIVFDSFGIGNAPDATQFGDPEANTLKHVAESISDFSLPTLTSLGLGCIETVPYIPSVHRPLGWHGRMRERSAGKDTTSGHWELAGVTLTTPFDTFPNGFPEEIIRAVEKEIGRSVLWNRPASGSEIIDRLGGEHLDTGFPIVYTSADSVFQIAAHTDVYALDALYALCRWVRALLDRSGLRVGRVIARPFTGHPGAFVRTPDRKDFSLPPPRPTILDRLSERGIETIGVGKIGNIFSHRGVQRDIPTRSDAEGMAALRTLIKEAAPSFIFVNLVELDTDYGHRKDPVGYGRHLAMLDRELQSVLSLLNESDLLMVTGDHGTDPTTPGTDHTREEVPLLATTPKARGRSLGLRESFADVAQTIAENFAVPTSTFSVGNSFLSELRNREAADQTD